MTGRYFLPIQEKRRHLEKAVRNAKPFYHNQIRSGHASGFSSRAVAASFGRAANFAQGFPVAIQLGFGTTSSDAGDPAIARRVFINNATNGIPTEKGHSWDLTRDALIPVKLLKLPRTYVSTGFRHSSYTANFTYIGGNEDFDVTSSNWGIGAGLGSDFAVSRRMDLMLNLGLDCYFSSTLTGHDTQYSPDGTAVNPREDYAYGDADSAVGQPKFRARLATGLQNHFRVCQSVSLPARCSSVDGMRQHLIQATEFAPGTDSRSPW